MKNIGPSPTGRDARKSPALRRGFTLLELLVVMAISVILFGLIFGPVVTAFNLTTRARTQVESQAAARNTMSTLSRLLSNAVFIYDNAQTPINFWFRAKDDPTQQRVMPIRFAMVEYVIPARQLDQQPGNIPIDPTTGQPIYSDSLPSGQSGFATPLAPGRSIGRIFVALLNNATTVHVPVGGDPKQNGMPLNPYVNQYEDKGVAGDNRYALYRAEVVAYVPATTFDPSDKSGKYVVDTRLFHTDSKGNILLHDPNFFYDNSLAGDGSQKYAVPGWKDLNKDGKVQIAENWRAVSSPLIQTEKADMVVLDRDDANNIVYDANGLPTARPLATFSPTFFQNDPGVPTSLENTANEATNPAPTTFTSQYTHWETPFRVLIYHNPAVFNNASQNQNNVDPGSDPLTLNPMDVYEYVTLPDGTTKIVHHTNVAPGSTLPDPTTMPNVGPDPATGLFLPTTEFAFTVDPQRGIINLAFPSSVLINNNGAAVPARYSPVEINNHLNAAGPTGQFEKRYLDLRTLQNNDPNDTVFGQLNPATAVSPLGKYATTLDKVPLARIAPGSERVYGPDQMPGPHYGYRTLYTRVSANAGVIGMNQYKINYDDVRNANPAGENDPRVRIGYIEFNSDADSSYPNLPVDPAKINPLNPPYAPHSLPYFKIVVNNGNATAVAADPVEVTYNFQMNRHNDVVKIDYLTRSMMNVSLQTRLYDQNTGKAQTTELTNRIKIGNLQR